MTTELEKQFFDTFGIEPIAEYCRHQCNNELDESACIGCKYIEKVEYPQITDRQYLELICILGYFEIIYKPDNCEELKKYILKYYLNLDDSEIRELKHQVQAIFKEKRC